MEKTIPSVTDEQLERGHQNFLNHCSRTNPNSMLVWWPKIKDLGIAVPRTEFIPMDRAEAMPWTVDDIAPPESVLKTVREVERVADSFGYPCFMRTDVSSGKHDWKNTCFIPSRDKIEGNLRNLCGQHELWEILGVNYQAVAIREFLNLQKSFTAFSGEMLINREFRFFVRDGKVECFHFYWPEEAFDHHWARKAHDSDWKLKLKQMSELSYDELVLLSYDAEAAGRAVGGYWSVDFAAANDGKEPWYLIDMALGENSYHWPGCPNGPKN